MRKILVFALVVALPAIAAAQLVTLSGTFSGLQEVPPNSSPATGWATASVDLATGLFNLDYSFTGLTAPQTAAHIHEAPPGVAGPIILPLPVSQDVDYNTVITADQVSDLLAGLWYVNVHSTAYPAGEIRAQLFLDASPVPEPSTYAVAGAVLLCALAVMRRRKALH